MSDDMSGTNPVAPVAPPPPLPMRVLPVEYSDGQYSRLPLRRPGIITAMGVISIVIACLSMLASGFSGLMSMGMMFATQMSARTATVMAQQQAAARNSPATNSPNPARRGNQSIADISVGMNGLNA